MLDDNGAFVTLRVDRDTIDGMKVSMEAARRSELSTLHHRTFPSYMRSRTLHTHPAGGGEPTVSGAHQGLSLDAIRERQHGQRSALGSAAGVKRTHAQWLADSILYGQLVQAERLCLLPETLPLLMPRNQRVELSAPTIWHSDYACPVVAAGDPATASYMLPEDGSQRPYAPHRLPGVGTNVRVVYRSHHKLALPSSALPPEPVAYNNARSRASPRPEAYSVRGILYNNAFSVPRVTVLKHASPEPTKTMERKLSEERRHSVPRDTGLMVASEPTKIMERRLSEERRQSLPQVTGLMDVSLEPTKSKKKTTSKGKENGPAFEEPSPFVFVRFSEEPPVEPMMEPEPVVFVPPVVAIGDPEDWVTPDGTPQAGQNRRRSVSPSSVASPGRRYEEWKEPVKVKPRRAALVIGVGHYTCPAPWGGGLTPRNICCADAKDMAILLEAVGYNVTLLTTDSLSVAERPTRQAILGAVANLRKRYFRPVDITCVFFSGATHWTRGAERNYEDALLLPCDVDFESLATENFLTSMNENFITLRQLMNEDAGLEESVTVGKKKHEDASLGNFVFMDTYSAFGTARGGLEGGIGHVYGRKCIGGHLHAEYLAKHSLLMTYYLKRALLGKGMRDSKVTMNGTNAYIASHLRKLGVAVDTSSSPLLMGDTVLAKAADIVLMKYDSKKAKKISYVTPASFCISFVARRNVDTESSMFRTRLLVNLGRSAKLKELKGKLKEAVTVMACRSVLQDRQWLLRMAVEVDKSIMTPSRTADDAQMEVITMTGDHRTRFQFQCMSGTVVGAVKLPTDSASSKLMQRLIAKTNWREVSAGVSSPSASSPRGPAIPVMAGMVPDPQLARWKMGGLAVEDIRLVVHVRLEGSEYMCRKVDRAVRTGELADVGMTVDFKSYLHDVNALPRDTATRRLQAWVRAISSRESLGPRIVVARDEVAARRDVLYNEIDERDGILTSVALGRTGALEREEGIARAEFLAWEEEDHVLIFKKQNANTELFERCCRTGIAVEEMCERHDTAEHSGRMTIVVVERATASVLRLQMRHDMDESKARSAIRREEADALLDIKDSWFQASKKPSKKK